MTKTPTLQDLKESDFRSLADHISNRRKLMTVDEVADLLSIAKTTIYDMANDGRLPCVRIGGSRRFDPNDVATLIRKNRSAVA